MLIGVAVAEIEDYQFFQSFIKCISLCSICNSVK